MNEHMSCSDALDQLWALIDNELCTDDAQRVQEHLDRCRRCYPQYDFDRAYRQLVAMQCRETAPAELRRKVFMRLLEESS
ncbi:MAG TPA: mycothiol system anti-sigma-R factor [Longimicrobiales bacterium]|nr:mycothiol system anti-sigma-R factor [Longimicrobiales bacterium]